MNIYQRILLFLLLFSFTNGYTNHWMGGEITWTCMGSGNYVFRLKIYRDCNGPVVTTSPQTIRVWNHTTINSITVNHIGANDISPTCNQVVGAPSPINCLSPVNGASEEHIFESAPITLNGIPPAQGWVFTWDNFSRSNAISNLVNPSSKGITLRAIMFNTGTNTNPCFDSSPQFDEIPSLITCAGKSFTYNPSAYDPDLDSLVFSFGVPLDRITTTYNPPVDPPVLTFETGYSQQSPLPNQTLNPNNIPAAINSSSGEITFKSFTQGTFVLVMKVESYRCGRLISEVNREMQVTNISCSGTNNPPVFVPPFNGGTSYFDTVNVGDLVQFSIIASDNELLQDGSSQTITLDAISSQFGTAFTDSSNGCEKTPCATLNTNPPINGVGTASLNFEWQTTCNHISNTGCAGLNTYNFIFKAKDDFCQIPGISYATVSITVIPIEPISPPEIKCVNTMSNGNIAVNWSPVNDEFGTFNGFEVLASTNGTNFTSVGTISDINQTSFVDVLNNGNLGSVSYIIAVKSGCNGGATTYSDTVSSIFLNVNNPGNGTAILQWNPLAVPNVSTNTGEYRIFREYPKGIFTFLGTKQYGSEFYRDTITICSDSIWYFVTSIDQSVCQSSSNIIGDEFEDLMPPVVPKIKQVSVDTSTGYATVSWNPSTPGDVEGYIILHNNNGNWVIIDTVYGINNTFYLDTNSQAGNFSEQYGIAVFDSCWKGSPASPNTSAMGTPHKSIYLNYNYSICDREIKLKWNNYINWTTGVSKYKVYRITSVGSVLLTTIFNSDTTFLIENVNPNQNYCFVIEASSNDAKISISNKICIRTNYPNQNEINYTQVATVNDNNEIELRVYQDINSSIQGYDIYRSEDGFNFSRLDFLPFVGVSPLIYSDVNVFADERFYFYKNILIDSCGAIRGQSNTSKTILLNVKTDQNNLTNTLAWNHYQGWDGVIQSYKVYRKVDGVLEPSPIATLSSGTKQYIDDVSSFLNTSSEGEFCYFVEANEFVNSFAISEKSKSNEDCGYLDNQVFTPNSFTPNGDGLNDVFLPILNFVDGNDYIFRVFNRWSHEIFTSKDKSEGWNAIYKGKLVPEGIYVYTIEFDDAEGKRILQRGYVNVLK